jgi:predicted permease
MVRTASLWTIWLPSFVADCRFGLRQLRRSPVFTVVAITVLALGIAANTAIFSILDPLLLRNLQVSNPNELVWVNSTGTLGPAEISELDTFYVYRDKARVFAGVLAFSRSAPYEIRLDGRATVAKGQLVSGDYFAVLGVRPISGRLFEEGDEHGLATVVLSYEFWRREFGSDPHAVGKVFQFGDQVDASRTASAVLRPYIIIGVAPRYFFGTEVGESPDFYMPLGTADLPSQDYWQTHGVTIFARLKSGVSVSQAQSALDPLLQEAVKTSTIPAVELRESFSRVLITSAARGISATRAKFSLPTRILMIAVGLVLLIACGNIAGLLLVRGTVRRREITVRLALGASRARLIRQLITENALLAVAGVVAGVAIGQWATRLLVNSLSTRQLPVVLLTRLDGRLLVFTAFLLTITVCVCGVVPAFSVTRDELAQELKAQGSDCQNSLSRSRLGKILVVAQITLSMTLLASTGLTLRSLYNLETFDVGFDRDKVLTVRMNGYSASRSRSQTAAFFDLLVERLKQLPGVHSVSYSGFTPMSSNEVGVNIEAEGYTLKPGEVANVRFVGVSPGYFDTMGIPLIVGRDFTQADVHADSQSYQVTNVAIINKTMAQRFFGGSYPVGKHIRFVEGNRPPLEIIGVVADSKYNHLRESATDFFYIPGTHGDLEVRTSMPGIKLSDSIREVLSSLDNSVSITEIRTLREQVDESLHPERMVSALCGTFSMLALTLTCVGLYGLLAFDVLLRTSEIGVRMALGAEPRDILQLVVGQGMRLTCLGLALGSLGGICAGMLLASFLFNVRQTDALTYLGVSIILFGASALACYLPARHAMRLAPMVALRHE